MIGWTVDTAPPAIMRSSRIRRLRALQPRRTRKALSDMDDSFLFKHVRGVAGLILTAVLLRIGLKGLDFSLWLDEAWVANSVRANTLAQMFWGEAWLQTTPPLFLLLSRAVVSIFGVSTPVLRFIPLAFALIAGAGMWFAARRVAPTLAPIAAAALMLPSLAIEYFTSFKQYGPEAAAVVLMLWATFAYLQSPERWRLAVLCVCLIGLLPLAYPLAFVAPGIVLAVYAKSGMKRASILTVAFSAMLGILYVFFIRPNVAPVHWQYWSAGFSEGYSTTLRIAVVVVLLLSIRAVFRRDYTQLVCLLPCVLLVAAERLGWYPESPRTFLFARPCLILAAAIFAEEYIGRGRETWRRWARPIAAVATIVWALVVFSKYKSEPLEDYAAAVSYLREHMAPNDLLLVHANALEGFRLYAAMANWDAPAIYGNSGWPCCQRNHPVPDASLPTEQKESIVRADLERMIPSDFRGRIWLVYASRWRHWRYVGLDEGEFSRKVLWNGGCTLGAYILLPNIQISAMDCTAQNWR